MKNKFVIPLLLVLIFSLIYNIIKIDSRMGFLKNENGIYLMGATASLTGIIFCIVIFRLNLLKKMVEETKG